MSVLQQNLPSLQQTIEVSWPGKQGNQLENTIAWQDFIVPDATAPSFEALAFEHPTRLAMASPPIRRW
jgi:hypothetical protein